MLFNIRPYLSSIPDTASGKGAIFAFSGTFVCHQKTYLGLLCAYYAIVSFSPLWTSTITLFSSYIFGAAFTIRSPLPTIPSNYIVTTTNWWATLLFYLAHVSSSTEPIAGFPDTRTTGANLDQSQHGFSELFGLCPHTRWLYPQVYSLQNDPLKYPNLRNLTPQEIQLTLVDGTEDELS